MGGGFSSYPPVFGLKTFTRPQLICLTFVFVGWQRWQLSLQGMLLKITVPAGLTVPPPLIQLVPIPINTQRHPTHWLESQPVVHVIRWSSQSELVNKTLIQLESISNSLFSLLKYGSPNPQPPVKDPWGGGLITTSLPSRINMKHYIGNKTEGHF